MAQKNRSVLKILFTNFINSFRPRQITGDYMGNDNLGNKYYEIPADPRIGKRKPSRWFEPTVKDNYVQEVPAEWEAWLRGRRNDPPTAEELAKNLQIMIMKKENAAKIEAKFGSGKGSLKPAEKGMESFPKYDEYEIMPGQHQDKKTKD